MRAANRNAFAWLWLVLIFAAGCAETSYVQRADAPSSRRRDESTEASVRAASVEDNIEVYFSPEGGATDAIVAEIARARSSVRVQAFAFTSQPIADAIVDAHHRGLDVTVTLDENRATEKSSIGRWLWDQSVPVFVDNQHTNAHSKIILIDERILITGSFNFTKSAEINNAENLLVIRGKPKLLKAYRANFDQHLVHSVPYHKWLDSVSTTRP